MFYEHNQVEDLLSCKSCNERYDIPLLLPCWKTLCQRCVTNKSNNQTKLLACPFCSHVHQVPDCGFESNETLIALLKLKPVDVHRAEMFRSLGDLLKKLQLNMDDLNLMEKGAHKNLLEYFELIKGEIKLSAKTLIEQVVKYRDKLLKDIEYFKKQSFDGINDLFTSKTFLEFKRDCVRKKTEWQHIITSTTNDTSHTPTATTNINEDRLKQVLAEANLLSQSLEDKKCFIQSMISSNKLVFNQRQPNYLTDHKLSSSLIGQLEFNEDSKLSIDHSLKIKYLNDLVKLHSVKYEPNINSIFMVPMLFKRLLHVYKSTFDDVSDVCLSICDMSGKVLCETSENFKCSINAVSCYLNFVLVSLTDFKTGRDLLKLYNSSLELISCCVLEFKSTELFMNESYLYTKLDSNYPFLFKFDYNLTRQPLHYEPEACSDLFLSFVVDKLIYVSSSLNRIYFMDNCFAKIKVFSELNGNLIDTIHMSNFRDSSIYIDSSLIDKQSNEQQFICLNSNDKLIRLYDSSGNVLVENELAQEIKSTSKFYLTQDSSYVFVDDLNDSIYFYH